MITLGSPETSVEAPERVIFSV